MSILFGKAKKQPTTKESIMQLRESVDMLEKREKLLQTKIETELKSAQANRTKNKKAALLALKRKKMYEDQLERNMNSRITLETQIASIESANVNLETLNAMKQGADAMKRIHGAMKIEQVDQTMDEIRDQMDLSKEISDAISQPLGVGNDLDDDELLAELDALEQEELDAKLLDVNTPAAAILNTVPGIPTTEPAVAQPPRPARQQVTEDEDAELAELRASMAIAFDSKQKYALIEPVISFVHDHVKYDISLKLNKDLFYGNSVYEFIRRDGRIETGVIQSRAFKGIVRVKGSDHVGWARLVQVDSGSAATALESSGPKFEGSFMYGGDSFHVSTVENFQRIHKAAFNMEPSKSTIAKLLYRDNIVYKDSMFSGKFSQGNLSCETSKFHEVPEEQDSMIQKRSLSTEDSCPLTKKVVRFGMVVDCNFYRLYESSSEVVSQIVSIMNSVNQVFEGQLNVLIKLAKIQIFESCNSDPSFNFACEYSDDLMTGRLNKFSEYISNFTETTDIPLWHLATTCYSNSRVGVSWLGTLCQSKSKRIDRPGDAAPLRISAACAVTSMTMYGWRIFAHEIAHNFNAKHDCDSNQCQKDCKFDNTPGSPKCDSCQACVPGCDCKNQYLMSAAGDFPQVVFSPRSVQAMCQKIAESSTCLLDADSDFSSMFQPNICGNGIKDKGEECDCGAPDSEECLMNSCCDPYTCKLNEGAVCDDNNDLCCRNCQFKKAGEICRNSIGACDLNEFCTGKSGSCPPERFREEMSPCSIRGKSGVCVRGECTSRAIQCFQKGSETFVGECPGYSDQCLMYCIESSGKCTDVRSLYAEGTPCGAKNRGSCVNGQCTFSGFAVLETWVDDHMASFIAISTTIFTAMVLLLFRLFTFLRERRTTKYKKVRTKITKKNYPVKIFLENQDVIEPFRGTYEDQSSLESGVPRRQSLLQSVMRTFTSSYSKANYEEVKNSDSEGEGSDPTKSRQRRGDTRLPRSPRGLTSTLPDVDDYVEDDSRAMKLAEIRRRPSQREGE